MKGDACYPDFGDDYHYDRLLMLAPAPKDPIAKLTCVLLMSCYRDVAEEFRMVVITGIASWVSAALNLSSLHFTGPVFQGAMLGTLHSLVSVAKTVV